MSDTRLSDMQVSHVTCHAEQMSRKRTGGSQIGPRQRGKAPTYDPASGYTYRAGVSLNPEDAVKAIAMAERAGLSISGFFNALLKTAAIDPNTGLPVGIAPAEDDNALPLVHQEAS